MTRKEAFMEINKTQDEYVERLFSLIDDPAYSSMKSINFTSPTGTGKTKMMCKLINKLPNFYFIITTLSKGQLHLQIKNSFSVDCLQNNYTVYGSADYRINSKLEAEDIISKIPHNTQCIWLRDEGHIKTNRFEELLAKKCFKIINFSATNQQSDILCNFTHTMMLRTVNQTSGTPEDAIKKLVEIKRAHSLIPNYNPCAIFRCVGGNEKLYDEIIELCKIYQLKYIDISVESYVMAELCEDNNTYDVIINRFKIVEGIDIRRAHVLFIDNQPTNNATTIQVIGRCRRNALLYRDDIDILAPENEELLKQTRECFVFYNVDKMRIDTDESGELQLAFCNHVSCEAIKPNTTVSVKNGQLSNGLFVIELYGKTGSFDILTDKETGFNVVYPNTDFYNTVYDTDYLYACCHPNWHDDSFPYNIKGFYKKIKYSNIKQLPFYEKSEIEKKELGSYYLLIENNCFHNVKCIVSSDSLKLFSRLKQSFSYDSFCSEYSNNCIDLILNKDIVGFKLWEIDYLREYVTNYRTINEYQDGQATLMRWLDDLDPELKTDSYRSHSPLIDKYGMLYLQYYLIRERELGKKYDEISKKQDILFHALSELKDIHKNGETTFSIKKNDKRIIKLIYLVFEQDFSFVDAIRTDSSRKFGILPFSKKISAIRFQKSMIKETTIEENDITNYFETIINKDYNYLCSDYIYNKIINALHISEENLKNGNLDSLWISYEHLFEELTPEELLLSAHIAKTEMLEYPTYINSEEYILSAIADKEIKKYDYIKTVNDKESAIVGVDLMRLVHKKEGTDWVESTAVSSKIGNYNKFNLFLSRKYAEELSSVKSQLFSGNNNFELNKKCNSMIGYCVEYYSKYLVFGESYLEEYIEKIKDELYVKNVDKSIIVKACMLKYREMMIHTFGTGVGKVIKTISSKDLYYKHEYKYFVNLIVELGKKTANYVKKTLYYNKSANNDIDPNLSIRHISGLADYITTDTILDVKVRNNIDEKSIRQVLAYHYLSTKRSDLHINRVIVYDAVSDRAVAVNICKDNLI